MGGSRASTVTSLPVLAEEPLAMAPTAMTADGHGQVWAPRSVGVDLEQTGECRRKEVYFHHRKTAKT